jgi:hypothetical protein
MANVNIPSLSLDAPSIPAPPVDDAPLEPKFTAPPKELARKEPEVNKLFRMVMEHEASDLHL